MERDPLKDPIPVFLSPLLFKNEVGLERIIRFFNVFNSTTRWELFYHLYREEGKLSVDELALKMKINQSSICYHLDIFMQEGLLEKVKYGTYSYYQIRWRAFREIQHLLSEEETESRPLEGEG